MRGKKKKHKKTLSVFAVRLTRKVNKFRVYNLVPRHLFNQDLMKQNLISCLFFLPSNVAILTQIPNMFLLSSYLSYTLSSLFYFSIFPLFYTFCKYFIKLLLEFLLILDRPFILLLFFLFISFVVVF